MSDDEEVAKALECQSKGIGFEGATISIAPARYWVGGGICVGEVSASFAELESGAVSIPGVTKLDKETLKAGEAGRGEREQQKNETEKKKAEEAKRRRIQEKEEQDRQRQREVEAREREEEAQVRRWQTEVREKEAEERAREAEERTLEQEARKVEREREAEKRAREAEERALEQEARRVEAEARQVEAKARKLKQEREAAEKRSMDLLSENLMLRRLEGQEKKLPKKLISTHCAGTLYKPGKLEIQGSHPWALEMLEGWNKMQEAAKLQRVQQRHDQVSKLGKSANLDFYVDGRLCTVKDLDPGKTKTEEWKFEGKATSYRIFRKSVDVVYVERLEKDESTPDITSEAITVKIPSGSHLFKVRGVGGYRRSMMTWSY